jgi:DNA-binding transcriptional LysR family regulator
MELRHLKYFVAVAEELNFARAARRVHIAQPSLTKQIQQLEQELGFPLLYRTKKKVELLDTGHVFLDEAQRLLRQADGAIQSARRTHSGESGRLVILFSQSAAPEVLPKILRRYHALYPKVVVDLLEIVTIKNAESFLESAVSVALVRSPTFLSHELFSFETIQHERFPGGITRFTSLGKTEEHPNQELSERASDRSPSSSRMGICRRNVPDLPRLWN